MKLRTFCLLALSSLASALSSRACDHCAISNVMDAQAGGGKGWNARIAEQFTHFGTLQEDGRKVGNDARQRLDSLVTQVVLGHSFHERFGLQLNVPFIYRDFRRPEEGRGIRHDDTAGVGDLSVLGNFVALRQESEKSTFTWTLTAGVKAPTGSTRRLKEETLEGHSHGAEEAPAEHSHADAAHEHHEEAEHDEAEATPPEEALPESGIHGHDLTLGSGSWDGVVGTSFFLRQQRFFFTGAVQYAIRSEGDYGYRFANDLIWNGGPGVYLALRESYTASLQLNCSGEHKGKDRFRGADSEDTGFSALYLGPEVRATWKDRMSAEVGADFPLSIDNTALQIVPTYRLRASISIPF
jgi:hypothetical protein